MQRHPCHAGPIVAQLWADWLESHRRTYWRFYVKQGTASAYPRRRK